MAVIIDHILKTRHRTVHKRLEAFRKHLLLGEGSDIERAIPAFGGIALDNHGVGSQIGAYVEIDILDLELTSRESHQCRLGSRHNLVTLETRGIDHHCDRGIVADYHTGEPVAHLVTGLEDSLRLEVRQRYTITFGDGIDIFYV